MHPLIERVLRGLGFAPSLSDNWCWERSTHHYRLTVDRTGSVSVEVFKVGPFSGHLHFTRWPDRSTSLSGSLRHEPRED